MTDGSLPPPLSTGAKSGRSTKQSEAAFAAFRSRSRFSSLDGLRFFCIAAVLWHHSPVRNLLQGSLPILGRGFLGVDFFFVLSGFLITTLLLREEDRKGNFSLRGFYWRRILRIIPVYFLVVTAASAYFVVVKGYWQYAPLIPFYYLFLANFLTLHMPLLTPTWSLSVEEQYYLVWPLLLRLIPRRAVLPVLGGLIIVNVLGIMGMLGINHGIHLGILDIHLPNATYGPILLGSALAVVLDSRRGFSLLYSLVGHRFAPIWTAALTLFFIWAGPQDLRGLPNLVIHLTMVACLASLVLREDHAARTLMTWSPVARVGEISYGIYLYHLIGLHIGNFLAARLPGPLAGNPWSVLVLYVPISYGIAELSYCTFEAQFRKFRHGRAARTVPIG